MDTSLYESPTTCNVLHPTGNILIIFLMRFSNVFGSTVNVRTKAIKFMTKSGTFSQDAYVEFSFPFGLITSINLLLLDFHLHLQCSKVQLSNSQLSLSLSLKVKSSTRLCGICNNALIIFLFTCKVTYWLSFLTTADFKVSLEVAIEFLFIGSWNDILCCIKGSFLKVSANDLPTSIIFRISSARLSSTAT